MLCWSDATLRFDNAFPILLGEINYESVAIEPENFSLILQGKSQDSYYQWAVQAMNQRHGGRWMASFCDGHVENLRPDDLHNKTNAIAMRRWNRDHQPHIDGLPP